MKYKGFGYFFANTIEHRMSWIHVSISGLRSKFAVNTPRVRVESMLVFLIFFFLFFGCCCFSTAMATFSSMLFTSILLITFRLVVINAIIIYVTFTNNIIVIKNRIALVYTCVANCFIKIFAI